MAGLMLTGAWAKGCSGDGTGGSTAAEHQVIFLPPNGWRSQIDVPNATIQWISVDDTSRLRLKITLNGSGQAPQLRPEDLRQVVLQELPAAKIIEEFICHTGSGSGLAFDVERLVDGQFPMSSRLAYVPFSGGRVEIHLSAPTEQFSRRQIDLTGFLNSLQIQPATVGVRPGSKSRNSSSGEQ